MTKEKAHLVNYFSCFKRLRNRLKQYSRFEIFDACMENIVNLWGIELIDIVKENKPTPMNLFLLMKWGTCFGEHPSNSKKSFKLNDFKEIYAAIVDLPANLKFLNKEDPYGLSKFMRANAPNQLHYQTDTGLHGLAVLETIINTIGIPYDYDRTMLKACGMTVKEFIDLQLSILQIIANETNYKSYRIDFYKYLFGTYTKEKIQQFLDNMSCDHSTLVDFMVEDHKHVGNPEFEQALFTPLYRKPLFRRGGQYYPYHKTLLTANIEFGVYDILKEHDAGPFCSAFGEGFENYISNAIGLINESFLREADIRKITHKDRSCDFLIPGTAGSVFVEAKSAEMHFLTRQSSEPDYLRRTLQNSLISGYLQILTTAFYLKEIEHDTVASQNLFGIIVTYKNLMLGYPDEIWEEFMYDFMKSELPQDIQDNLPVLPEKIFVLSSLEFDYLALYCHKNGKTFADCLEIVQSNNANPSGRKVFVYDNFGESLNVLQIPTLTSSFKSIQGRIMKALKKGQEGL